VKLIRWFSPGLRTIFSVYLAVSLFAHCIWEILQLPLYTLWATGTFRQIAFSVVHCTIGDVMIAGFSLLAALALFGHTTWPCSGTARGYTASLALGLGYTIFSEWLNTGPRQSWTYSDWMPIMPFLGTGMAPLLQWIVVPTVAFWIAIGRSPWSEEASCSETLR
jgi:hypothetical protein